MRLHTFRLIYTGLTVLCLDDGVVMFSLLLYTVTHCGAFRSQLTPLPGAPATRIGTPRYFAPEMRGELERPVYSQPADVYSLGVMMAEAIVAVTSQVRVPVPVAAGCRCFTDQSDAA